MLSLSFNPLALATLEPCKPILILAWSYSTFRWIVVLHLPDLVFGGLQIPLYPATIFQSETDGEGMNFVLYFKLSDSYNKELPLHFQESLRVRWIS